MSENELPTPENAPEEGVENTLNSKSTSSYAPKAVNYSVRLQYPIDKPYSGADVKAIFADPNLHLTFINGTLGDLKEATDNHPNIEVEGDAGTRRWVESLERGSANLLRNEPFQAALDQEGGDWQQTVESAGQPMGISRPRFAESGTVLTGERAVMRMTAALGLGYHPPSTAVAYWYLGQFQSAV